LSKILYQSTALAESKDLSALNRRAAVACCDLALRANILFQVAPAA